MKSYFYITPLLLYYPRFIPNIETQPLLTTILALCCLVFGRNSRAAPAFFIFACSLTFWIAIKVLLDESLSSALSLIQILVGPLILFGALGLQAQPPSRRIIASVTVYLLLCAILEIFASGVYDILASSLLSRVSIFDGHRGISLLTPEPTYAAISCIYFLMLAWWSGKHWGFRFRWIEPVLILCLLATGSTYVVILLLALLYVMKPRAMLTVTVIATLAVPLTSFVALDNEDSIRVVVAISRFLSSDFSDFLPSISILDSSLGSRLATNLASFLTLFHSPMGLGLDCEAVPKALVASGFDFALNNPVLSSVVEDGCLKPQSYAAATALGLGVVSIPFIFLFVVLVRYVRRNTTGTLWAPPFALAIVMVVVQAQLTNPIPWLLFFLSLAGHSKYPRLFRNKSKCLTSSDRLYER